MVWAALLIAPCWGGSLLELTQKLTAALQSPLDITWTEQSAPSIFVCTGLYVLGLAVYFSSRGRTRDGEEHGSAAWDSAREVNRQFAQKRSKILTRHVRLGLDSRKHRRSLNVLVIGGSGAAKTRSYVLPNILEANTNYVITDPKSEVLLATGGYLKSKGYEIRVLNLVNLSESDGYNPFCYLRDEKDALKLVNNLIQAKYGRVLFLKEYAAFIKDKLIRELTDLDRNLMLSIDVIPVPTDEAVREMQNRLLGVETNVASWQRRQNSNNNFSAIVPYDLEQQRQEVREMLDDLTTRDQRMLFALVTLVHLADSKEQLDSDTETLQSIARQNLCQLSTLHYQQADGLITALPLGLRRIDALRTLTTPKLWLF